MSATEFDISEFLSSVEMGIPDSYRPDDTRTEGSPRETYYEPGYEGKIDPRIRQLSYSSLLSLHSCPRKFQLNRLRTTHRTEESIKSTVTFAFGHVVGTAIAQTFEGLEEDQILWNIFIGWHTDLLASDPKLSKSIWTAIIAYQRLAALLRAGFLKDYELVYYQDKPAVELSFVINFPDGFRLRGFVDAVLRHKESGKVIVLECKTTGSATVHPATFKNSAQAIGYSIVLDAIYPDLSSYDVLYLIYQTKSQEYNPIPFTKTFQMRALWIRELLLDIETIKMYEEAEIYPMRGESCFSFFRECEYFQTCTLSTEYLTKPCTEEEIDKTEYQISIGLEELLEAQFRKVDSI